MEKVIKYFDTRFNELQSQIKRKPEKKKRKIEVEEKFNKRGHKIQFDFNANLVDDIEEIIDKIDDDDNEISAGLLNVISKIKRTNKMIKIADSSEEGWAVVE